MAKGLEDLIPGDLPDYEIALRQAEAAEEAPFYRPGYVKMRERSQAMTEAGEVARAAAVNAGECPASKKCCYTHIEGTRRGMDIAKPKLDCVGVRFTGRNE